MTHFGILVDQLFEMLHNISRIINYYCCHLSFPFQLSNSTEAKCGILKNEVIYEYSNNIIIGRKSLHST
jgi:hypothetical protein